MISTEEAYIAIKTCIHEIRNPKQLYMEIKNCIALASFQTYLQNMWSHFVETGSCTTSKLQKGKQKQEHWGFRHWGARLQPEPLLLQHLLALQNYIYLSGTRDKNPHSFTIRYIFSPHLIEDSHIQVLIEKQNTSFFLHFLIWALQNINMFSPKHKSLLLLVSHRTNKAFSKKWEKKIFSKT